MLAWLGILFQSEDNVSFTFVLISHLCFVCICRILKELLPCETFRVIYHEEKRITNSLNHFSNKEFASLDFSIRLTFTYDDVCAD